MKKCMSLLCFFLCVSNLAADEVSTGLNILADELVALARVIKGEPVGAPIDPIKTDPEPVLVVQPEQKKDSIEQVLHGGVKQLSDIVLLAGVLERGVAKSKDPQTTQQERMAIKAVREKIENILKETMSPENQKRKDFFYRAILSGDVNLVKRLTGSQPEGDKSLKIGFEAVAYAVYSEKLAMIREIFQEKENEKYLNHVLYKACQDGQTDLIEFCIKRGANPGLPCKTAKGNADIDGSTALHAACASAKLEERESSKSGKPPFFWRLVEMVGKVFEKEGASPTFSFVLNTVDIKDAQGHTPLIKACQRGHLNIVKYLVPAGTNDVLAEIPKDLLYKGYWAKFYTWAMGTDKLMAADCTQGDVYTVTCADMMGHYVIPSDINKLPIFFVIEGIVEDIQDIQKLDSVNRKSEIEKKVLTRLSLFRHLAKKYADKDKDRYKKILDSYFTGEGFEHEFASGDCEYRGNDTYDVMVGKKIENFVDPESREKFKKTYMKIYTEVFEDKKS